MLEELNRLKRKKMKSYVYKPKCKNCLMTGARYKFMCKSCGTVYHACIKEISKKSEKVIYCEYPGAPFVDGEWFQDYWKHQFKDNLIRTKN